MTAEFVADFEKRFPNGPVVRAALRFSAGGFGVTVLFGPSGAGKTTVLRCMAGLDRPDRGTVRFGAETWFDRAAGVSLPPQRREVGYLFQDYALFPHLTAGENIAYGLRGLPAPERQKRVREAATLLGLAGLEGRYPKQLSGGERQRVALARALVRRPRLFLLDEPLSALDAPTRAQLRGELRRLLAGVGVPAVVVTHDRVEALALGDSVVVIDTGQVCQSGPVNEVFSRPASVRVARVVGVETVEEAAVVSTADGLTTVAVGWARLAAAAPAPGGGRCAVCIRAEDVALGRDAAAAAGPVNRLDAHVVRLTPEGPLVRVTLDCGFPLTAVVPSHTCIEWGLKEGDRVTAVVKAASVHLVPHA